MNDDRHDATLFIGLHKLAQQNGDGRVPELYELLTRAADDMPENGRGTGEVVRFPSSRVRASCGGDADRHTAAAAIIPLRRV